MALFDRSASRVTGPLACYAAGFAADLTARGWSTDSIYRHLWLMRDLSAWMSAEGLDTGHLSPSAVERCADDAAHLTGEVPVVHWNRLTSIS